MIYDIYIYEYLIYIYDMYMIYIIYIHICKRPINHVRLPEGHSPWLDFLRPSAPQAIGAWRVGLPGGAPVEPGDGRCPVKESP